MGVFMFVHGDEKVQSFAQSQHLRNLEHRSDWLANIKRQQQQLTD